jgi:hypothetical protein
MGIDFAAHNEQVDAENAAASAGSNVPTGRVGRGDTDFRWVVPVGGDNNDLSQLVQEAFVKPGEVSMSEKRLIYVLIANSPNPETSGAFLPYGWDGDWSKVQFEELTAHAAQFGNGRRVVALSLPKTLYDAIRNIGNSVDDPVTYVNFETGEVVSDGVTYRAIRSGTKQTDTKYSAVQITKKADVAKINELIGAGVTVVPPQEGRLPAVAERVRVATAEKVAKVAPATTAAAHGF